MIGGRSGAVRRDVRVPRAEAAIDRDVMRHNLGVVRSAVGEAHWVRELLQAGGRTSRVMVMPPHPLVLEAVDYPGDGELKARQLDTRSMRTLDEST